MLGPFCTNGPSHDKEISHEIGPILVEDRANLGKDWFNLQA
jgi:hypothetical protein